MQRRLRFLLALLLPSLAILPASAQTPKSAEAVAATVETTLSTGSGQIRQFAFDADPNTYFASTQNAGSKDHFTLLFDRAVTVKSIAVTTGRPKGGDPLDAGILEVSADGKQFTELAKFADGVARAKPDGRQIRAVRIKPSADLKHPLAIREFVIDSTPPVALFRYPVEFVVNVEDAPEMREWAEKVARLCERWYPRINDELPSEGFKPPTVVTMSLKTSYKGVAAAGGGRITGSVAYFKKRPDDVGAMIHETVHIVQRYRTRNNPGWLVEGIADYIRFFKYEPGKLKPLTPERARYDGSYRVSAAFLGYLTEKYDKEIVRKLNKAMREGEYKEDLFKVLTKKTLKELGEEWRASLRRAAASAEKLKERVLRSEARGLRIEDRGLRIEDRARFQFSIFDPRSSICGVDIPLSPGETGSCDDDFSDPRVSC